MGIGCKYLNSMRQRSWRRGKKLAQGNSCGKKLAPDASDGIEKSCARCLARDLQCQKP
jgi:hypothetical protein